MRICSLLPSATEIVFALGEGTSLVGRTHECDYPPEVFKVPSVARTNIAPGLSSSEIDAAVSSARRRVFYTDLVTPPYCGSHWMKELVEMAGGRDELANLHRPSYRIEWQRVQEWAPEVIVLTCCGFDLERNLKEAELL